MPVSHSYLLVAAYLMIMFLSSMNSLTQFVYLMYLYYIKNPEVSFKFKFSITTRKMAKDPSLETCRKTFNLGEHFTKAELTRVYHKMALKTHPDKNGNNEEMVELNRHRELLDEYLESLIKSKGEFSHREADILKQRSRNTSFQRPASSREQSSAEYPFGRANFRENTSWTKPQPSASRFSWSSNLKNSWFNPQSRKAKSQYQPTKEDGAADDNAKRKSSSHGAGMEETAKTQNTQNQSEATFDEVLLIIKNLPSLSWNAPRDHKPLYIYGDYDPSIGVS